ncbi:unnamed protein product, partial [Linum tenue]
MKLGLKASLGSVGFVLLRSSSRLVTSCVPASFRFLWIGFSRAGAAFRWRSTCDDFASDDGYTWRWNQLGYGVVLHWALCVCLWANMFGLLTLLLGLCVWAFFPP